MGLDTSHDCWHGPYSAFMRWRTEICRAAGYGSILERDGFGGPTPWPSVADDPLVILLCHSDCDGSIAHEHCAAIADRLEALLPDLVTAGEHRWDWRAVTEQFIAGLRKAADRSEDVEFH